MALQSHSSFQSITINDIYLGQGHWREALFAVLDIEDNYVEAPILLLEMNRHLK